MLNEVKMIENNTGIKDKRISTHMLDANKLSSKPSREMDSILIEYSQEIPHDYRYWT